jgi:hypothetical protein
VTDPDGAVISVPGSTRGAQVYLLRTWRLALEGLRNPAWRDLSAGPGTTRSPGARASMTTPLLRRHGDEATRIRVSNVGS